MGTRQDEIVDDCAEIAAAISKLVNSTSRRATKQLGEMLTVDHPTLVQHKMAMFMHFVGVMAEKEPDDIRWEATVRLARRIMEISPLERTLPAL